MSEQNNINQRILKIEQILSEIESGELQIEQVVDKYKQALMLAKEIDARLDEIENQIEVLDQQF